VIRYRKIARSREATHRSISISTPSTFLPGRTTDVPLLAPGDS
jgi:hypothetical protein